jgi:hypothetical protein
LIFGELIFWASFWPPVEAADVESDHESPEITDLVTVPMAIHCVPIRAQDEQALSLYKLLHRRADEGRPQPPCLIERWLDG